MLAIDPSSAFEYRLGDGPGGCVFLLKHISVRQKRAILRFLADWDAARDGPAPVSGQTMDELMDRHDRLLSETIAGWRGMENTSGQPITLADRRTIAPGQEVPYSPADLDQLVTSREAWDLLWAVLSGASLSETDAKKSSSQSPTAAERSAQDAPASGTA